MAVAFKDLKIENNVEVKTFTYNDNEIEVLQYLSSEKKDNLLQVVIQNCDGTVIDTFAADLLFHLYLFLEHCLFLLFYYSLFPEKFHHHRHMSFSHIYLKYINM